MNFFINVAKTVFILKSTIIFVVKDKIICKKSYFSPFVVIVVVIVIIVHDLDILDNQHDHVDKSKPKCEVASNGDPLHS